MVQKWHINRVDLICVYGLLVVLPYLKNRVEERKCGITENSQERRGTLIWSVRIVRVISNEAIFVNIT